MDGELEDVSLLEEWAGGNSAAGAALLSRYQSSLFRFFSTKAPEVADDLTQSTLLACLEKPERVRERNSFRSYIFGIARHLLYQHYRAGGVRRGRRCLSASNVLDRGPSPSTLMGRQEEDVNLMRALASLPVEMRIMLELAYWEDVSTIELADVMGVAENTVYSRLHRAKHRLRLALEQLESV